MCFKDVAFFLFRASLFLKNYGRGLKTVVGAKGMFTMKYFCSKNPLFVSAEFF